MTREEAKKILERIVNTSNELTHPVILNTEMGAIKVAIGALKNEEVQLKSMIEYLHNTGWLQEHIKSVVGQQWIPCSERLPKEDVNVLVTVHFHGAKKTPTKGSYYVEVANQIGGEWCSYSDEYKVEKDRHEVIAWMPLPEPYKGEE